MSRRKVNSGSANRNSNQRRNRRSNNEVKAENQTSAKPADKGGRSKSNKRDNSAILPSAVTLQEYEYATEGAANRILDMAEKEAENRRALEEEYLRFYKKNQRLGMLFGFIVLLSVIFAGYNLAMAGHDVVAEILIAGGFFSVALSYHFSKKERYVPARKRR